MKLIGRENEKLILSEARKSNRPEFIAVYGRRRVGKTFLVSNVFQNDICFEMSGIHSSSMREQLLNFHIILKNKGLNVNKPDNWIEAFDQLSHYLDKLAGQKKKVVFLDEFPWFDTRRSNFLPAFENFWNSYAQKRQDLIVVICGSAASYVIKKVIKNRGGLHNRLTRKIHLLPFNLNETEKFLENQLVKLSRYDITQLYMAIGGIPQYLEFIQPGESVAQIIDRLCFAKEGFLRTEFDNVFASLFDMHENHEAIIRTLANVRKGLTRNEILKKSKLNSGGTTTKTLLELEESGFIEKYVPYGQKSRDALYRITDEYCLFYLKFIENSKPSGTGNWNKIFIQSSYKIWSGFSFETICIKHIDQIKEGLRISGIHSTYGSWYNRNQEGNAQIDLLIDRDDNVISVCEMKFYNTEFTIDFEYSKLLTNKMNAFRSSTKTKKNLFLTFITTYGLTDNEFKKQIVQNELYLDDLFKQL
jgi:AAA+ ATPase superfamily predicted ATPase